MLPQIIEPILKRIWGSGRAIELDDTAIHVEDRRQGKGGNFSLTWSDTVNLAGYYWEVETRKSRVRRGWYCVAIQAMQKEQELILYSFLSPENVSDIQDFRDYFFRLLPKDARERLTQVDPREAAMQERYRRIESHRWFDGAELKPQDFIHVLSYLREHGSFKRI